MKVYECWNFDIIQAIPMKVAAIVKGTGNKLVEDNVSLSVTFVASVVFVAGE